MKYSLTPDPTSIYFRCVEDCNDTMMLTDASGSILYVNRAWERTYGYAKDEVVGKRASVLHSGKHDEKFYQDMWKAISDPKIGYWRGEVINRAKSGKLVNVLLMITPFKREDGQICGYSGIATDITAQKELEASRKQQEILAAVRQFAEGLAHEVGTTLAVIRGRAEFIEGHINNTSIVASGSETIVQQADRVQRLIGYLLRFCRNSNPVEFKDLNMSALIAEIKSYIDSRNPHLPIRFNAELKEVAKLRGDSGRVRDILMNFIHNAQDAIEEAVAKGRCDGHEICVRVKRVDGEYQITIQDTGCGIDPRNLDKIFQPYFTTKDIGKAAGLGLSIASRLAQDMGGRVSVQSQAGVGSTFTLHLPVAA